jgi:diguanylate cyclase (GGDEF)-like protein
MTAAPNPANEAERLQALGEYAVRGSAEEQAYDDITRLASQVCETPIALLSLVDSDREWFLSRVGWETGELPRAQAFSAHTILEPGDLLVVNDATLDPRFSDNPLVTGDPGIRFYAGAPLVTPQGLALGALSVLDCTPRELSSDRLVALRALSRQVMVQAEMRRAVAVLQRGNTELQSREWQLEDYRRHMETENALLEEQRMTDELTGIGNRRAFDRALNQELARAQRHGTPVSLLLVDIDRFKAFNNVFGRGGGDKVLQATAGLLATSTRPFDVVARYDGEEFAVILSNTGESAAVRVGDRLRRTVEAAPWKQQAITVSVGASTVEGDGEGEAIIAEAADALRHAKQGGRNLVRHAVRYR